MKTALEAALAYASRNWHVFPIAPAPEKKPLTKHGFKEATLQRSQIEEWWTKWPNAQVGVACGPSGICPIDLDIKLDEGIDGRTALEVRAERDSFGCDLEMRTPSGGSQLFYKAPDDVIARRLSVLPGVDVLGAGGYTIVPSPASPGREWRYGDPLNPDDLQPMPSWIEEFARHDANAPRNGSEPRIALRSNEDRRLPPSQVKDIRRALQHIDNWERKNWLRVCFALKSTGAGQQAYDLWTQWSMSTPTGGVHPKFNLKDQLRTWRLAKQFFLDGSEVSIETLFYMAKQGGYDGPMPDDSVPTDLIKFAVAKPPEVEKQEAPKQNELDVDSPLPDPKGSSTLLSDWFDVAKMPPIEWQVEGVLPKQSITILGGDTEAGKSFAMLDLVLHQLYGINWCGRRTLPGSTIYLCGEGHAGIAGRLNAWKKAHGHRITGKSTGGRYLLISDQIPVLSAKRIPQLHAMIQQVTRDRGHPPSMIVIDTLSQSLDDDENDAKVVAPIMRGLAALRTRWRCTIVVVHHLVKLMTKGLKPGEKAPKPGRDSLRGSGAITRNADTVLGLVVSAGGTRELFVWKQKDGGKPEAVRMHLTEFETGRTREDGEPETSCAMIPDVEVNLGSQAAPGSTIPGGDAEGAADADRGGAAIEAVMQKLLTTMLAQKAFEGAGSQGGLSKNGLMEEAGVGSKKQAYAAIERAVRHELVRNVGTSRNWSLLLTEKGVESIKDSGPSGPQ